MVASIYHFGHSKAVQTQMDKTHMEQWLAAMGHNGGQDVGQCNERTKTPANGQRHHKQRLRHFEERCWM